MKQLLIAFTLVCVFSATALAGEMPGGGKSSTGDMPGVGSTSTTAETPAPVPGEMPGVGPATSSTTDPSLVATVLLTIMLL